MRRICSQEIYDTFVRRFHDLQFNRSPMLVINCLRAVEQVCDEVQIPEVQFYNDLRSLLLELESVSLSDGLNDLENADISGYSTTDIHRILAVTAEMFNASKQNFRVQTCNPQKPASWRHASISSLIYNKRGTEGLMSVLLAEAFHHVGIDQRIVTIAGTFFVEARYGIRANDVFLIDCANAGKPASFREQKMRFCNMCGIPFDSDSASILTCFKDICTERSYGEMHQVLVFKQIQYLFEFFSIKGDWRNAAMMLELMHSVRSKEFPTLIRDLGLVYGRLGMKDDSKVCLGAYVASVAGKSDPCYVTYCTLAGIKP
jgi:hypothetical protein